MTKRRSFIKKSSLGLLAGLGTVGCASAKVNPVNQPMSIKSAGIPDNLTILFQGDSITDAGRDRGAYYANNSSNLKPDLMSLMIGVNDYWHKFNGRYDGTAQLYNDGLRALLDRTYSALPNLKLIMLEPFAVAGGSAITEVWNRDFTPYREFARNIAKDYKAKLIPTHTLFQNALKEAPASYWCPDGVHPSLAGGHLIASAWLEAFNGIYA